MQYAKLPFRTVGNGGGEGQAPAGRARARSPAMPEERAVSW
jgi:hypothetical protein